MLTKRNLEVTNEGISLNVLGASTDRVFEAFLDIANGPPTSGASLAADIKNKIKEKWDGFLPEDLLCKNFASTDLAVDDAVACAKEIASSYTR